MPKLEELILLAVSKRGPDITAGDVQAILSKVIGREQAFGSIFTTLDRLSDKKFVKWRKGLPEDSRGGRAPRLYTITGTGERTLKSSLAATRALADGLDLSDLPVPAGA